MAESPSALSETVMEPDIDHFSQDAQTQPASMAPEAASAAFDDAQSFCGVLGFQDLLKGNSLDNLEKLPSFGAGSLSMDDMVKLASNTFAAINQQASSASPTPTPTETSPASETEARLSEAIQTGGFDLRSSIGQSWAKALKNNADLKGAYDREVGRAAKAAFRLQWAETKLKEAQTSRTKVYGEDFRIVNTKNGKYLSFKRVWDAEGNDLLGFRSALLYTSKCAAMGEPWIWKDDMAENFKFLYFEVGVNEAHTRSWGLYKEAIETTMPQQRAAAKGSREGGQRPIAAAPTGVPTPSKGEKRKAIKNEPSPPGKKVKSPLELKLMEVQRLRAFYIQTTGQVAALHSEITANEQLAALRGNDLMMKKLTDARNLVTNSLSPFRKSVLATTSAMEIKQLQKSDEQLLLELSNMVSELRPLLEALDKETKAMHRIKNSMLAE